MQIQNNVLDDDEPSYWPPGVTLPIISNSTTPTSITPTQRYVAPLRILHDNSYDDREEGHHESHHGAWDASGGNTDLEETLKAILSNQNDMKDKMQSLSRRMNYLEEMIAVSSSNTSGSDDTLKKQQIPTELSVLTCLN